MPTSPVPGFASERQKLLTETRDSWLADEARARATHSETEAALTIARHTRRESDRALAEEESVLAIAFVLGRQLAAARLGVAQLAASARVAHDDATAATAAIAAASQRLSTVATAVVSLAGEVAGIAAITLADDPTNPVDRAAREAVAALRPMAEAGEALTLLALHATVAAAQPRTLLLLQSCDAAAQNLARLTTASESARAAATEALAAAHAARDVEFTALAVQSTRADVARDQAAACAKTIRLLDLPEPAAGDDPRLSTYRELQSAQLLAQRAQSAAQAIHTARLAQVSSLQPHLDAARATCASAQLFLATAHAIDADLAHAETHAPDARLQADAIRLSFDPVLAQTQALSRGLLPALAALDRLQAQVARRIGKNELIPAVLVERVASAQACGAAAFALALDAQRQCGHAHIAATQARFSAAAAADRVRAALPLFRLPSGGPAAPSTTAASADKFSALALALQQNDLPLPVLLGRHARAARSAESLQSKTLARAKADLDTARDALDRANATAQSAAAALAAAETALK